ncbi:MAG: serine hydrolase [Eubacteriales bacterium]|nr:serine hydrolase [Eubacteriales bacterium]
MNCGRISKLKTILAIFIVLQLSLTMLPIAAEYEIYPQLIPQVQRPGLAPIQLDLSDLQLASPNIIIREFFADGTYTDYHRELASDPVYPASMTKMMSTLVILRGLREKGIPLQEVVEVQQSDVQGLAAAGASIMGLLIGELIPIREALYGVLLPSGSDSLRLLHRLVHQDETSFVADMNKTAQALGMKGTHFANSTGLFDPYNYTTPEDLTLLLHCLLQDPLFREICSTRSYTTPPTNLHGEGIYLEHTIQYYGDKLNIDNASITGGKTGWLPEAGYCFTSFRTFGDRLVIVSTERAREAGQQIEDHAKIYRFLEEHLPPLPEDVSVPNESERWQTALSPKEAGLDDGTPLKPPQPELHGAAKKLELKILETMDAKGANEYISRIKRTKNLRFVYYSLPVLGLIVLISSLHHYREKRRRYKRPKRL